MSPGRAPQGFTRRQLLVRSGWIAAGTTALTSCTSWVPALPTFGDPSLDDSCVWVQALPDGRIRFLCPKSEMGQGIATGFAQIVAEELDVPAHRIEVVHPHTSQIAPAKMTVGSQSVSEFFEPLSIAAAALRETLRGHAARRAGVEGAQIADADGGFALPDGARVEYADLVAGEPQIVTAEPALANGDLVRRSAAGQAHKHIGQRWSPTHAEEIVTGRAVFSRDVEVPGMTYGHVIHAPRFGATLTRANLEQVRALPGVVGVAVTPEKDAIGIVTETPFQSQAVVDVLEPEWGGGETFEQSDLDERLDVDAAIAADEFEHEVSDQGDLEQGAALAAAGLRERYDTSFLAHASMEPRAAVADVRPDAVEVWAASQDPWYVRKRVARIAGRRNDDVVVHTHRLGGGFGGRSRCQAAEEATWLSAAVGRPVRVQWTREDEMRHNYFQPQFAHRIEAGMDTEGGLCLWRHDFTAQPIIFTSALIPEHLHWVVDIPGDPGTGRNALPSYTLPNRRVRYSDVRIPVPTGAWRGLGVAPNVFATESAIDELAHASGQDPLEFRLRNLPDDQVRLKRVLERAAELSGWGAPTPPGVGRGIACSTYKDTTFVAVVAEVAVDDDGIRPLRMVCAHDCGLVINPDQVEAQIEGNLIWGLSMALLERTTVTNGAMSADNFHTYPILRNSRAPEIEIALIREGEHGPSGAGEPAIAPVPAAVANAVFSASGQRLRRLPLDPGAPP